MQYSANARTVSGAEGFTVGYHLGTVGTWVRILVGVLASLALITTDLTVTRPDPAFWWETFLWFLAVGGVYTAVYVTLAARVLPRLNPWVSTLVFYGPVLALPYLEALPATLRLAMTLYIVGSIALVVVMRYGGNAVVALPALITGRRHVVYCPWNAADLVDKAIEDSRWSGDLQGAAVRVVAVVVLISVLATGFFTVGPTEPVVWVLAFSASVATTAVWVACRRLLTQPEVTVE
jgi:hypothetical protein